jgi:hypothetical protein
MNFRCILGHRWNGCKCENCGKTRDKEHDYVFIKEKCCKKCTVCGSELALEHVLSGGKCVKCGIDVKIVEFATSLKQRYQQNAAQIVGKKNCNDCGEPLSPGNSYLRAGGSVCCEACVDRFIEGVTKKI